MNPIQIDFKLRFTIKAERERYEDETQHVITLPGYIRRNVNGEMYLLAPLTQRTGNVQGCFDGIRFREIELFRPEITTMKETYGSTTIKLSCSGIVSYASVELFSPDGTNKWIGTLKAGVWIYPSGNYDAYLSDVSYAITLTDRNAAALLTL